MLELINDTLITYAYIGILATLYVVVFFILTGVTVFEGQEKGFMPFRYKVSYVLVMCAIFPCVYIAFFYEIVSLRKIYELRAGIA
ncbi:hypothetical protein [Photobacterium kagoshimensis]|uniref:hypothetical protein n=1 Tax=Photobacterium kagoshimensis TaxID=2910242 RepID=UPI003D0E27E8